MRKDLVEQHLREYARAGVRAGLLDDEALHRELTAAIDAELPLASRHGREPGEVAATWLAELREELEREQAGWPLRTDHDRLEAAFAELERLGVAVLQGCEDHWAAQALLDGATPRPRGVLWFTPPDVWHAVDEGMLEVNLWHGTSANAAPGDALLEEVLSVLARHGLAAHFDEGRIEVAAHWQRRTRRGRTSPAGGTDRGDPATRLAP